MSINTTDTQSRYHNHIPVNRTSAISSPSSTVYTSAVHSRVSELSSSHKATSGVPKPASSNGGTFVEVKASTSKLVKSPTLAQLQEPIKNKMQSLEKNGELSAEQREQYNCELENLEKKWESDKVEKRIRKATGMIDGLEEHIDALVKAQLNRTNSNTQARYEVTETANEQQAWIALRAKLVEEHAKNRGKCVIL